MIKKKGAPLFIETKADLPSQVQERMEIAKKEKDAMGTTTGSKKGGLMPSEPD